MAVSDKSFGVNIEGYGRFTVDKPSEYNDETVDDVIAEAVAQTMNLLKPSEQKKRFHPVLGFGGYEDT